MRIEYAPCYIANDIIYVLGHLHHSYESALEEVKQISADEFEHYGEPITDIFVGQHQVSPWIKL